MLWMLYLQVQKEIRQIQGCKCILDEKVGVLEEGAVEKLEPQDSLSCCTLWSRACGWMDILEQRDISQLLNALT